MNPNIENKNCTECKQPFTNDNVYSVNGWKETQLSGFCELCFDKLFDMNEKNVGHPCESMSMSGEGGYA